MANRRCLHALSRRAWAVFSSEARLPSLRTLLSPRIEPINPITAHFGRSFTTRCSHWSHPRFFSSNGVKDDASEDDADDDDDDDDEEDEEMDYSDGESVGNSSASSLKKEYTAEEAEAEAAEIGYKVVGPLERSDRVFKPYEPVFAVIQIGSHQFKVSNGDCIFAERLKFCDVNDKLILNKVLLLGSSTQTIIGRPIVPDAAVHAVVEEHALDAKVIIFKKKRRKNYRRTKGHRQELTKLRITDIQGIEKPEKIITVKPKLKPTKAAEKKPEKVPA